MIRISVVTITYNAAQLLPRTLDSISCQTHPAIEHLIIDGASTDDTLAIATRYKEQSDAESGRDVIIRSEPDRGIYDAMNKGLRLATGDYVLFLNAGDVLPTPGTLELVADCVKYHPSSATEARPAVVYGDTAITDARGNVLHPRRLCPPRHLSWRSFRSGMLVCHQAFYARLDIARHVAYDLHYRHSADVDWCIRVMKVAEQQQLELRRVDAVIAHFAEGGNTTQHHRTSLRERFDVMCRHYGLPTTLLMHAWFVVRAAVSRLNPRLRWSY